MKSKFAEMRLKQVTISHMYVMKAIRDRVQVRFVFVMRCIGQMDTKYCTNHIYFWLL